MASRPFAFIPDIIKAIGDAPSERMHAGVLMSVPAKRDIVRVPRGLDYAEAANPFRRALCRICIGGDRFQSEARRLNAL
jgi:hypothetical protein